MGTGSESDGGASVIRSHRRAKVTGVHRWNQGPKSAGLEFMEGRLNQVRALEGGPGSLLRTEPLSRVWGRKRLCCELLGKGWPPGSSSLLPHLQEPGQSRNEPESTCSPIHDVAAGSEPRAQPERAGTPDPQAPEDASDAPLQVAEGVAIRYGSGENGYLSPESSRAPATVHRKRGEF